MDLWHLLRMVSQRSLLSCRLELEDRRLDRASLFPLFDDDGRTRMVLITAEEDGRILLNEWAPGLFARDWALRNRLRLRYTDLVDASTWDPERFGDLWHFDPRWVLGEARYQGHGSVPHLRSTNIPGHDRTISGVVFESSLERAAYVVRQSDEWMSVRRFDVRTLADAVKSRRAAQVRPRAPAAGWQLRPFWRFP
jgi:hypothetical protein